MPKLIDLIGQRFDRLTVIRREGISNDGQAAWLCKCDCGAEVVVAGNSLRRNHTKSCGCYAREKTGNINRKHGMSHSRIYNIWSKMNRRCGYEKENRYHDYGGRGITVCEEWQSSFEAFRDWAFANGYTDNLTIDRINNDFGYCPANCRWVNMKVQANNTRRNHELTCNGETHTLAQWEKITGIRQHTIGDRIRAGWSIEKALTTPIKKES